MNIGEKVKLTKKTFMNNGVFILTNSLVEIVDKEGELFTVIYNDKEGHPHTIPNLKPEDLSSI